MGIREEARKQSREELLIEIKSKFRKNICGAGLIYMALEELIEAGRPITPEAIATTLYVPLKWVLQYEYIYSQYIDYLSV